MNEEKLIQRAQKNIKEFDKLYELYSDKIKRYVRSKVNNDDFIADDLTSITFEKAIKNIKSFRWQGVSFSAWIYKIANNSIIDYYRKQKDTSNVEMDNIKDKSNSIEDVATKLDSETRIKSLINKLPKREQEVIFLKFFEGYTNKAISKKLGVSETNVGTIIYRTMDKLKVLLFDELMSSRETKN